MNENAPVDRLALSRERLRRAMGGAPPPAAPNPAQQPPTERTSSGDWRQMLNTLKAHPVAATLINAATHWWTRHPLHLVGIVAAGAATSMVRPVAQRHPLALVVGALLAGGVLAWSRPWRWRLTSTLLVGLMPQAVSKIASLVVNAQRPPPPSAP